MSKDFKIKLYAIIMLLGSIFYVVMATLTATDLKSKIISWMCLAFFGACAVAVFVMKRKEKQGHIYLGIEEEGIRMDDVLISWENIYAISKSNINRTELWLIHTNNIEEDIQNTKGIIARWGKKFSYKTSGAIYSVSPFWWKNDFSDFAEECMKQKGDLKIFK